MVRGSPPQGAPPMAATPNPPEPTELSVGRLVRSGEPLSGWAGEVGAGLQRDAAGQLVVTSAGPGFLCCGAAGQLCVKPAVQVSEDRVEATLELRSPVADEAPLSREEIAAALTELGVTHGVEPARVEAAWRIFEARGELLRPMRVARGREPVAGRLARIDFEPDVLPHADQGDKTGRIDFHERGRVINVVEGQLLGTWIPGEPSKAGEAIDGEAIAVPESARSKPLRTGKNIRRSELPEDEAGPIQLFAAKSGVLLIDEGIPSVSLVLLIDGDVDLETGNIDAEGSVVVKGAVRSGFKVKASDGLVVHGIAEGADLEAGGDMELKKGLIGSDETLVVVGGNLRIKYAQNAHLEVRGDVELGDSDMGSTIVCSGRLRAASGRGRLRGGDYHAAQGIRAKELGSDLGALTRAAVGRDVLRDRERSTLTERLDELKHEGLKAKRMTGKPGSFAARTAEKRRREIQKQEHNLRAKLAAFDREKPDLVEAPEIRIQSSVHFGSELEIMGVHLRPSETTGGRVFAFDPATQTVEARSA